MGTSFNEGKIYDYGNPKFCDLIDSKSYQTCEGSRGSSGCWSDRNLSLIPVLDIVWDKENLMILMPWLGFYLNE